MARFTVVVSTKVFKKATDRNRLKRVIREYLHKRLSAWPKGDYIITVKPQTSRIPEVVAMQELILLLNKIRI